MSVQARAVSAALLLCLFSTAHAIPERASITAADAVARLRANAGGDMVHKARRGAASVMLRSDGSRPLAADAGGDAVERAHRFMSIYGAAVGVQRPAEQLELTRVSRDVRDGRHVHLAQLHRGLPVFGARLVVHLDNAGVNGVNGAFVPVPASLAVEPQLEVATARASALTYAGKLHRGRALAVQSGRWLVYPVGLIQGHYSTSRLAYEAVVTAAAGDVRERIFIDAIDGRVLDRVNEIHRALNREVYTGDMNAAPVLDEQASSLLTPAGPAQVPLIDDPGHNGTTDSGDAPGEPNSNLWIFAGGTYALYSDMFGRAGYDACDPSGPPCQPDAPGPVWSPTRGDPTPGSGQIQKSVYLIGAACPNAYWNGASTNYCPGFDADDIVSHEWSHGYTEYTSGLIYAYQSGALNESYSDIFGETYDLLNNIEGPLGSLTLTEHLYYEEGGSRWVVGEDLSEEAAALLLRDMWKPDDFPATTPGKATSGNFVCGSGDGGGVHTNSSVPNHAFAMLVDGTSGQGPEGSPPAERNAYNGQSFAGIGMVKAAHIYFHAQDNLQTPTTGFPEHADALRASCAALTGVNLKGPSGAPSGQSITAADCAVLEKAILATELDLGAPTCPFLPVLAQDPPATCAGAQTVFSEDWESGDDGWSKTSAGRFAEWEDDTRDLRDFVLKSGGLPQGHTGTAAFAYNIPIGEPGGGTCQPGGDYSGAFTYDGPEFTVPAGAVDMKLRFDHYVRTEATADGGQLEISVNGGTFTLVAQSDFIYNAPNSTLLGLADTSNNPDGGEFAWNGSDINPPSGAPPSQWGTTVVNLGALAQAGDTVRLRFKFAQEGCNGIDGWYVDDIRAYSCPVLDPPVLSLGSDYEDPDSNGAFTLNWTRPAGATGPDLVQTSTLSCAPLLADDAEGGLGKWVATTEGSGAQGWAASTTKVHGGNNAFFASYTNGSDAAELDNVPAAILTLKDAVAIPAAGETRLSYWDFYMNEGDDVVVLEVSADDGATWTVLDQGFRSELAPDAAPIVATEPLALRSFALDAWRGQSVKVRFRLQSGGEDRAGSTPFGWYVDDIAITNDLWDDVATAATPTLARTGQVNGTRCYRVRTAYTLGGELAPSPFSNIVSATVDADVVDLPPVANAGLDQVAGTGSVVTLDGRLSADPNGDPLTYSWRQLSGTSVTLTDATTARPGFTAPAAPGTLSFELSVRDPGGAESLDTVTVTIVEDAAAGTAGNNRLGGALPVPLLVVLGLAAGLSRRRR